MEPSRNRSRRAAQRRRAARRRRAQLRLICALLIIILAALLCFLLLFDHTDSPDTTEPTVTTDPISVVPKLVIDAGESIEPEMFLSDAEKYGNLASFKTDISTIDLCISGTHTLELTVDGKVYSTVLEVQDLDAPTAEAVPTETDVNVVPDPETLVTNLQDVSSVTVSYASQPDVSKGGKVIAEVLLTDGSGNTAVIEVPLTVIADETPPVIEGAVDLEFFVGDSITYKAGITVTDDKSTAPKLVVDNSQVDTTTAGTYPVTYTATDDAGNSSCVTVQLTLADKPEGYVEPEVLNELAQEILDEITTEDMTQMEVAFAIYKWTSTHIAYTGSSEKNDWTGGAYDAFTKRSGDCFNYFAAAKALYNVAGIENVDVVKSDTSHSSHYWSLINLGNGWYHVDCTPRSNPGKFFMNTDAELEAYSVKNRNSHIFDGSLYPERAEESVQDLVDYAAGKVYG